MSDPIIIDLDVSTDNAAVDLSVESDNTEIDFALSAPIVVDARHYEGSYVVTPSREEQTLATRNFYLTDNITVAPIPKNYGLITWNGSYITVS